MLKRWITIYSLFIVSLLPIMSQGDTTHLEGGHVMKGVIVDGDTLYMAEIEEVYIFNHDRFRSRWQAWKYRRLIRNVKKAYPYAKLARDKLREVNEHMLTLSTERQRKEYIKQVEEELKDEFEDELKKLTITQGRILIKLIYRETGNTSYELVKELRGTFSAFFWQTLARLFGSNLKDDFDPDGKDRLINEIVIMIENGQL